ncbi:MAG: Imm27 family immunity protein [Deltaproteobacteria bacterium]|jgi:hypothetical protein|nr:Imm27 family immunity protein [Deltaproteobacteria bacterium]MCW8892875.1 Imm27 family immunity protein [Deltaproteobacteria bacterium]MCW9049326.1 Imm27 family immunity protein [Deltaproteobacteria bacterium]
MNLEIEDFELTPETTWIRGYWIDLGSKVEKDSGWIRIEWLLQNRLDLLLQKDNKIGALYKNPVDETLWHFYPVAPDMQNGGPPALELIDKDKAMELFGEF